MRDDLLSHDALKQMVGRGEKTMEQRLKLAQLNLKREQARKTYVGRRVFMTEDDWRAQGWSDMNMAELLATPTTRAAAYVQMAPEHDGATGFEYELLPILTNSRNMHSPDGFEWGYGGSGPAELARRILWDWFDLGAQVVQEEAFTEGGDVNRPLRELGVSYQDFKTAFLVGASKEGFEIRGGLIAAWVIAQQKGRTYGN
jgi:hypothetical protein